MSERVESRRSDIHGIGVFATETIGAGEHIGVYEGEPTDVDGTYVLWVEADDPDTWHGIDGTGVLRYLNHSRSPNVEFDGADLYACRDIEPGEELVFDYGAEWADVP